MEDGSEWTTNAWETNTELKILCYKKAHFKAHAGETRFLDTQTGERPNKEGLYYEYNGVYCLMITPYNITTVLCLRVTRWIRLLSSVHVCPKQLSAFFHCGKLQRKCEQTVRWLYKRIIIPLLATTLKLLYRGLSDEGQLPV